MFVTELKVSSLASNNNFLSFQCSLFKTFCFHQRKIWVVCYCKRTQSSWMLHILILSDFHKCINEDVFSYSSTWLLRGGRSCAYSYSSLSKMAASQTFQTMWQRGKSTQEGCTQTSKCSAQNWHTSSPSKSLATATRPYSVQQGGEITIPSLTQKKRK